MNESTVRKIVREELKKIKVQGGTQTGGNIVTSAHIQQAQLDRIEEMLKQLLTSQPIYPRSVNDEISQIEAQGGSIADHLRAKAKAANGRGARKCNSLKPTSPD